jgi:hypothetical protein
MSRVPPHIRSDQRALLPVLVPTAARVVHASASYGAAFALPMCCVLLLVVDGNMCVVLLSPERPHSAHTVRHNV